MRFTPLAIPDVILIEPKVHGDDRGFFMETWHSDRFAKMGIPAGFVQDNHSRSVRGTLRGLHYQVPRPQGKLVRVIQGEVFDVSVDLRRSSPTFGKWVGMTLSASNKCQLWVPQGFAHGFLVLSESADFVYRCTDYRYPQDERTLLWNDPGVAIDWPLPPAGQPLLSPKDQAGLPLSAAECFE